MDLPFLIKYQPKNINEFIIDNDFKAFIKLLLTNDNFNILLNGKSGTGKTCMLKIIINEYYNNYSKNDIEGNVLYINNLKDQGIQFYRNEVKTFCQTKCSIYGKKKTIIIDDLDSINDQSQQVFRNCIDNYSKNINFIASCCNNQKILENIQSRLLVIKLPDIKYDHLKLTFDRIKELENINIDTDAENLIIRLCDNSIRLLINYMEKLKLLDCPIDKHIVNNVCTNISFDTFNNLNNIMIIEKDLKKSLELIYEIYNNGYSIMDILDNYFFYIKTTDKLDDEIKYKIIKIICKYITIINDLHEHEIELALFVNNIIMIE
tara:strand:- start:376 stop:1335 length:960 start_codon:yes stop_codon:yes gene_type:complete